MSIAISGKEDLKELWFLNFKPGKVFIGDQGILEEMTAGSSKYYIIAG